MSLKTFSLLVVILALVGALIADEVAFRDIERLCLGTINDDQVRELVK